MHSATIARAVDGQPRSAPTAGCSAGGSTRATQAEKLGTRQLAAPQTANALLPRTLRKRVATHAEVEPQLGTPPPQHG
jgi:hypothetical protein